MSTTSTTSLGRRPLTVGALALAVLTTAAAASGTPAGAADTGDNGDAEDGAVPLACGDVVTDDVRLTADLVDCPGFDLLETRRGRIERVTLHGNGIGVTLGRSQRVRLDHVHAVGNEFAGLSATFSNRTLVRNSSFTGSEQGGIIDRFSRGSRYDENVIGGTGIVAPDGTIDRGGNRATGNAGGDCSPAIRCR